MTDDIETIEEQIQGRRDLDNPPLHLWNPPLSGDIPIVIDSEGTWFHEGGVIRREAIVRLFANILRREEDGEYYLVTPVEKWRITVTGHPLRVVDFDKRGQNGSGLLIATLNTGKQVAVEGEQRLYLDAATDNVAALSLPHGLTAICSRAAWYRLVDMASEEDGRPVVHSGGQAFDLAPPDDGE